MKRFKLENKLTLFTLFYIQEGKFVYNLVCSNILLLIRGWCLIYLIKIVCFTVIFKATQGNIFFSYFLN